MRCPNCGQRLADEAGRCPVCGTVIDEETRRQAMNEDDFASSSFEGTRQSMGEQASAALIRWLRMRSVIRRDR